MFHIGHHRKTHSVAAEKNRHLTPAPLTSLSVVKEREGAEIVYGSEECQRHSIELLEELGLPKGVLPLQDLVECGRVRESGFVWMKQKAPYEHFFEGTNTRVSYAVEVTAYVDKFKMKKMSGIKSKQMLLWVPITEMSIDGPKGNKILFRTPVGIGRSFPLTAFMTQQEQQKYLHFHHHHQEIKQNN